MRTYTHVIDFSYKNKKYSMFIDNQSKYYFLGINSNNDFEYLDIKEFLTLGALFSNPIEKMNIRGKKMNIAPKVIIAGSVVILTASSISFLGNDFYKNLDINNNSKQQIEYNIASSDKEYNSDISYNIEDSKDEFVVDTYVDAQSVKILSIYDSDYLYLYLDVKDVNLDDLFDAIESNDNINSNYKEILKNFCRDFIVKQPNAERRILFENLKTLKIVECKDAYELMAHTLYDNACACYKRNENCIYVLENNEYKKGTWDYQVIYHELCHCARSIWIDNDDKRIRIQSSGDNFKSVIIEEALNSIFAVSLFDYEEKDIAYQLQSNILKILVDNMDNYELFDYMNHSLSYFVSKLDEYHNDNNYAASILKLIEFQYDDYHDDSISASKEQYYPIYDYVSDFYYKNRINANTTPSEALDYANELLEKILFDVPSGYNIDVQHFYEYLDEYCNKIGFDIPDNLYIK